MSKLPFQFPGSASHPSRIRLGWTVETIDEAVEGSDESLHQRCELFELDGLVGGHDVLENFFATNGSLSMACTTGCRSRHHDDALVRCPCAPLCETELLEPLHCTRRSGRIDPESFGEVAHSPFGLLHEEIECVHLTDLEGVFANAEEMLDEPAHGCTASHFAPGATDAQRIFALYRVVEIDSGSIGGGHLDPRVQAQN
jgi:hypothetical protein